MPTLPGWIFQVLDLAEDYCDLRTLVPIFRVHVCFRSDIPRSVFAFYIKDSFFPVTTCLC